MCGRFTTKMTWAEIVALYRLTMEAPPHNIPPRYNVSRRKERTTQTQILRLHLRCPYASRLVAGPAAASS
jgi:putative SOS response-associated peptidase YedK